MKQAILDQLDAFEASLRALQRSVRALDVERVNRMELREHADSLATTWVEDLRSPLEHKFGIAPDSISEMSECMKRLHVLSRPGNRKSSYEDTLKSALRKFKDRFVLPIQQGSFHVESVFDLSNLVNGLSDVDESDYRRSAFEGWVMVG